jgi:hypothetical protein
VFVARIGGFEQDRRGARCEDDVDDFLERDIEVVRAFVIAPADVHSHGLGGYARGRGVERLDVGGDGAKELGFAEVLVAGVAAHREVGAVELELEAGGDDRLVLGPHRRDEVGKVGLVRGVELVRLERGDQPRAGRVHERRGPVAAPVERGSEAADVVVQRLEVDQLDLGDRARAREFLAAHDVAELLRELRHRGEVERRLARAVAAEAAEPLDHIGRVADLAEFAVADDADPGLDLPAHCLVDRGLDQAIELGGVVSLALVAREQQRDQLGAARQAADMGGGDHRAAISCMRINRKGESLSPARNGPVRSSRPSGGNE